MSYGILLIRIVVGLAFVVSGLWCGVGALGAAAIACFLTLPLGRSQAAVEQAAGGA